MLISGPPCQVLLMFGPEYARSCGIDALEPLGIYLPGDKNYPGKDCAWPVKQSYLSARSTSAFVACLQRSIDFVLAWCLQPLDSCRMHCRMSSPCTASLQLWRNLELEDRGRLGGPCSNGPQFGGEAGSGSASP